MNRSVHPLQAPPTPVAGLFVSVGGTIESLHFAFGDTDVLIIRAPGQ